jgi:hypothetical protein
LRRSLSPDTTLSTLNVVEQQLLSALRETPTETDCSVSMHVLEALGHVSRFQQEQWLIRHRMPRQGKTWYPSDEHWEYRAEVAEVAAPPVHAPLRAVSQPANALRAIVVKPLAPLPQRSRR